MIRKIFLENLALKGSAVVLAVILWFFVVSRGQTEFSLNVPIEYANIPSGLEIAKRTVNSVNVVIRTYESLGKSIRQEDVRVAIDVSKAKRGEGVFSIRKDDVKTPFGAAVLKIDPLTVKTFFEETLSKKVAIKPDITGNPESGYYVKSTEIKPEEIVIEGPKSEVRKVLVLKTEPIDITGFREDFRQEVALELPNANIRSKHDKADVHIRIVRRGK
ncbi:MAG TPA: CdaR family protein [Thermodesulfovibrionales bacterium]|nr:CdaR family protein [Thermodesulfovibrionales bacterium]